MRQSFYNVVGLLLFVFACALATCHAQDARVIPNRNHWGYDVVHGGPVTHIDRSTLTVSLPKLPGSVIVKPREGDQPGDTMLRMVSLFKELKAMKDPRVDELIKKYGIEVRDEDGKYVVR